ncbi:MAG: S1C family serine protease [Planctomycetota bacterium]
MIYYGQQSQRGHEALMVAVFCWIAFGMGAAQAASPEETIAGAARKVVKLYGAGGVRGLEAYQTGILISAEGYVVTVMSTVLDADEIDCVLDDGRRYKATLTGVDPRRELAVLRIEGEDLPSFSLQESPRVTVGTRIFAMSNLFGVAVGDERVSVQHGVVSGIVPLDARRGAYEAPYRGDVYILDCTTNNPGSPGGALVDWHGRLIGMLGKELRANASGIWLNYAMPIEEVARGYEAIQAGQAATPSDSQSPAVGMLFDALRMGVVLVPDLLDKTPPFIESICKDSAAAKAGLRPDDLLVAVNGRAVASRTAVQQALADLAEGDPVRFVIVRDGAIVECDLGQRPSDARKP